MIQKQTVICNWRRAIDERGLHEGERQRYLLVEFKTFICEDLMPWYSKGMTDFSLLEVNRYVLTDHWITSRDSQRRL